MEQLNPPETLTMPFANNGTKNDIPVSPTGTNKASLVDGFPLITSTPSDQGGIPPARADFNGALNLNSQFYFAFQNGWLPTFNPSVSEAIGGYPLGAKLWYFDATGGVNMLVSLKGNNTDNFILDPSFIGTSWKPVLVTADYVIQNYVNKSGDNMTGQLVMADGSNGIRFNGPAEGAGWVGGNQSLTDDQKEILYKFFTNPSSDVQTWKTQHPLKAGESYYLYVGADTYFNNRRVDDLGFIDSNNRYCTFGGSTLSTNPDGAWWDGTTETNVNLISSLAVTAADAPTSYNAGTTDNYYSINIDSTYGDLHLYTEYPQKGLFLNRAQNSAPWYYNGSAAYRILTTQDAPIFPSYTNGVQFTWENNTTYTAPNNGIISFVGYNQYRGGLRIFMGPNTSSPTLINIGDDINGNTKFYSFWFFVKKGQVMFQNTDGRDGFESRTWTFYQL